MGCTFLGHNDYRGGTSADSMAKGIFDNWNAMSKEFELGRGRYGDGGTCNLGHRKPQNAESMQGTLTKQGKAIHLSLLEATDEQ